jgi:glycosyltransferase involved in cell wall biosynthesis
MRLLQLVQKPQRRGAEVFAYQLSQELRRQGHEVFCAYLYPYQGAGGLPLTMQDRALDGREQHTFEKFPGAHPVLLRRLRHLISQIEPDIVQVNGARTVKYGALAHINRDRQRWALIYRNIGNPQDWVNGLHYRMFYKHIVMPQVDGIVGVSQTTLDNLKEFYRLDIPTQNIPGGVDPILFQPTIPAHEVRTMLQTPPDADVLLYVGSLTAEKRIDRLLAAYRRILAEQPSVYLWIVGDGVLRKQLEESVRLSGLESCVRFAGIQPDVANFMHAADLFVLSSDTEGIPAVILEAGMPGIPAVATRVGGVAECVIDGETGLLVEAQDEAGLAEAILQLLQNPHRRLAMGRKAQKWVCDNFDMKRIAQTYVEFYETVMAHRQLRENSHSG